MVKIRLKRMGAKKRPFYRLVVADARSPRDGRFIEEVGTYDPVTRPARVQIDADRVREWMRKGAQPTDTARKLLERESILPRAARSVAARAGAGAAETAAAAAVAAPGEPGEEPVVDVDEDVETAAEEG